MGIPVVNQTDFYFADGYDLTWPPASPRYQDAVQSSSTGGKWSNYGNEGFPCGPLPPQRTWVQPIFHGIAPADVIKWGNIYISLTKDWNLIEASIDNAIHKNTHFSRYAV